MSQFSDKTTRIQALLTALGALVLLVGTLRGKNTLMDYFELQKSRQVLQETVAKLEGDVGRLDLEITKIRESRSYALKVLRDKYHITEEHENIMFFAD